MAKFSNLIKRGKRFRLFNKKAAIALVIIIGLLITAGKAAAKRSTITVNDVPGWSWCLGDKIIAIDAGHGGVDPGAVGINKTLEKDINLEIAKKLQALFIQAGSRVVMIREDDRDFGYSQKLLQRKREDLAYRIKTAMESQASIFLSIHANSFPDRSQHGPQVFYHPDSPEGKALAESIQKSLNKIGSRKRQAKANQSYFILKNSEQVAVTVEVGFLSNPQEETKLNQPDYQQKIALAVFEGVANYLSR